jgi:hypothetical protein
MKMMLMWIRLKGLRAGLPLFCHESGPLSKVRTDTLCTDFIGLRSFLNLFLRSDFANRPSAVALYPFGTGTNVSVRSLARTYGKN